MGPEEDKNPNYKHCAMKRQKKVQVEQVTETGIIPQSYAASLEEGP